MKEPKTLEEAFTIITKEMEQMFIKKHKDYGKGNILDIEELGITFRVSEKLARLKHLYIKHESPENESIDDTWIDIATYVIFVSMDRKSWFRRLELKDKSTK